MAKSGKPPPRQSVRIDEVTSEQNGGLRRSDRKHVAPSTQPARPSKQHTQKNGATPVVKSKMGQPVKWVRTGSCCRHLSGCKNEGIKKHDEFCDTHQMRICRDPNCHMRGSAAGGFCTRHAARVSCNFAGGCTNQKQRASGLCKKHEKIRMKNIKASVMIRSLLQTNLERTRFLKMRGVVVLIQATVRGFQDTAATATATAPAADGDHAAAAVVGLAVPPEHEPHPQGGERPVDKPATNATTDALGDAPAPPVSNNNNDTVANHDELEEDDKEQNLPKKNEQDNTATYVNDENADPNLVGGNEEQEDDDLDFGGDGNDLEFEDKPEQPAEDEDASRIEFEKERAKLKCLVTRVLHILSLSDGYPRQIWEAIVGAVLEACICRPQYNIDKLIQLQNKLREEEKDQLGKLVASILLLETPQEHDSFHKLLCLAPDASDSDFERAFRRLSLYLHPDKDRYRTPNLEDAFKIVRNAYDAWRVRRDDEDQAADHVIAYFEAPSIAYLEAPLVAYLKAPYIAYLEAPRFVTHMQAPSFGPRTAVSQDIFLWRNAVVGHEPVDNSTNNGETEETGSQNQRAPVNIALGDDQRAGAYQTPSRRKVKTSSVLRKCLLFIPFFSVMILLGCAVMVHEPHHFSIGGYGGFPGGCYGNDSAKSGKGCDTNGYRGGSERKCIKLLPDSEKQHVFIGKKKKVASTSEAVENVHDVTHQLNHTVTSKYQQHRHVGYHDFMMLPTVSKKELLYPPPNHSNSHIVVLALKTMLSKPIEETTPADMKWCEEFPATCAMSVRGPMAMVCFSDSPANNGSAGGLNAMIENTPSPPDAYISYRAFISSGEFSRSLFPSHEEEARSIQESCNINAGAVSLLSTTMSPSNNNTRASGKPPFKDEHVDDEWNSNIADNINAPSGQHSSPLLRMFNRPHSPENPPVSPQPAGYADKSVDLLNEHDVADDIVRFSWDMNMNQFDCFVASIMTYNKNLDDCGDDDASGGFDPDGDENAKLKNMDDDITDNHQPAKHTANGVGHDKGLVMLIIVMAMVVEKQRRQLAARKERTIIAVEPFSAHLAAVRELRHRDGAVVAQTPSADAPGDDRASPFQGAIAGGPVPPSRQPRALPPAVDTLGGDVPVAQAARVTAPVSAPSGVDDPANLV